MKKFMLTYHAPPEAMAAMGEMSEEQRAEGMKPWMAWKEQMGDRLIDLGAPLMGTTRLQGNGSAAQAATDVTGYSIIQANDLEDARASLANHPHLQWDQGSGIQIMECIDM